MHELAVCQAMMAQLVDIARQHGAQRIVRVTVRIGPLSGVESELLREAFPMASAGSVAAGAELQIENLPIRVQCETCGQSSDVSLNRLLCAHCGSYHTRLQSGDELILASVELEQTPTVPIH